MKVWIVINGFEYEGENLNSMMIFDSEEKAIEEKGKRQNEPHCNNGGYVIVEEREVL